VAEGRAARPPRGFATRSTRFPDDGVCVVGPAVAPTWGSGRFAGIARDAAFVAEHLALRAAAVV
jgi:hypothetical protein